MSKAEPSQCFICGGGNEYTTEEHHAVPRRLNGSDQPENLYWLCGTCHNAVEEIYDDEFYQRLGIAVDEVENDAFVESELGTKVNPAESMSREIPIESDHTSSEWWGVHLTVTELENGEWPHTGFDRRVEQRLHTYLSESSDEIIAEYNNRKGEYVRPQELFKRLGGEVPPFVDPDGVPEVNFTHIPENERKIPRIYVTNTKKSCVDYDHPESGDPPELAQDSDRAMGMYERPKPYYRLHCNYCHTVFSQDEHADMARHLRLHHGVEDPYEHSDTAFGDGRNPFAEGSD